MIPVFIAALATVAFINHKYPEPSTGPRNELYTSPHGDINYPNIITFLKPSFEPSRFVSSKTSSNKVEARLDSYSTDPAKRARGAKEVVKNNYITGGGVGPSARIYQKYG